MSGRLTSSIAALGLVAAPAVMKFAESKTKVIDARASHEAAEETDGSEETEGALAPNLGPRPKPKETVFDGCTGAGSGAGDPALNVLKNRVDAPDSVHDATVDQILPIQASGSKKHRSEWSQDQLVQVAKYEGTPIRIEGYLAGAKEEGPESPNCGVDDTAHHDFHLYLVADPNDGKNLSVVIEMTPRVRKDHPDWTITALHQLQNDHARVRVTGWLMYDQEHAAEVGKSRGTLWEIHPITNFEEVKEP